MIKKIKKQCIVLLSGGLDSATVLNIALENYDVRALIFDYGQRHKFEISAAKKIAEIADIPTKLITIDLGQFGNSALTDNIEVPKNQDIGKEIPITYVPVRNTIFLSYALAYAEVNNIFDIFIGVMHWTTAAIQTVGLSLLKLLNRWQMRELNLHKEIKK